MVKGISISQNQLLCNGQYAEFQRLLEFDNHTKSQQQEKIKLRPAINQPHTNKESAKPGARSLKKQRRQINPQPYYPEGTETVSKSTKSEMKMEK